MVRRGELPLEEEVSLKAVVVMGIMGTTVLVVNVVWALLGLLLAL